MPNNPETLCHVCAALRVDGHQTDAVQHAVAAWLAEYDESDGAYPSEYPDRAASLLALIAHTAREHRPPAVDW